MTVDVGEDDIASRGSVTDRVHAVLVAAADLLAEPGRALRPASRDAGECRAALDVAERLLSAWVPDHPSDAGRADLLIGELRHVRLLLETRRLDRRQEGVEALHGALRRLRRATCASELVAQAPCEIASLGFQRVLFSWVDEHRWVPASVYTASGPEEARAIMAAGSAPYWHTRDLLESQMIRHRRPMLVQDALDNPYVHLDIQAVMHSRSYVAAPLVRRHGVVGFIHADESAENGIVDDFDRDLLSMFAEGFMLALERVELMAELTEVRAQVGRYAGALQGLAGALDTDAPAPPAHLAAAPPVGGGGGGAVGGVGGAAPWTQVLTRREEQVAHLVADGLSNAQIAERLYIAEETTKTHVRNLLRKLGADNRTHAGALWRSRLPTG